MLSIISAAIRGRVVLGFAALSLAASSLSLAETNTRPVISGAPTVSATVGQFYSFTPRVFDADGNKVAFKVTNAPSWAKFDRATGTISGTPTAPGTFANIILLVSDGKSNATLPAFSITVKAVVTGNAALSWKAPTEDENGNALGDLAGYRVVYGTSPDKMTQTVQVPSASVTSVSIEELSSGTYYFAVKAYTKSGLESSLSEVVYKTIM